MYQFGWVKVDRSAFLTEDFDARARGIWVTLKAMANLKPTLIRDNGGTFALPVGGLVFSQRKLARQLGMSPPTLKRYLNRLIRLGLITMKAAKEGTIAWIVELTKAIHTKLNAVGLARVQKEMHPERKYLDRSIIDHVNKSVPVAAKESFRYWKEEKYVKPTLSAETLSMREAFKRQIGIV